MLPFQPCTWCGKNISWKWIHRASNSISVFSPANTSIHQKMRFTPCFAYLSFFLSFHSLCVLYRARLTLSHAGTTYFQSTFWHARMKSSWREQKKGYHRRLGSIHKKVSDLFKTRVVQWEVLEFTNVMICTLVGLNLPEPIQHLLTQALLIFNQPFGTLGWRVVEESKKKGLPLKIRFNFLDWMHQKVSDLFKTRVVQWEFLEFANVMIGRLVSQTYIVRYANLHEPIQHFLT